MIASAHLSVDRGGLREAILYSSSRVSMSMLWKYSNLGIVYGTESSQGPLASFSSAADTIKQPGSLSGKVGKIAGCFVLVYKNPRCGSSSGRYIPFLTVLSLLWPVFRARACCRNVWKQGKHKPLHRSLAQLQALRQLPHPRASDSSQMLQSCSREQLRYVPNTRGMPNQPLWAYHCKEALCSRPVV